jgi:hypothetical protein
MTRNSAIPPLSGFFAASCDPLSPGVDAHAEVARRRARERRRRIGATFMSSGSASIRGRRLRFFCCPVRYGRRFVRPNNPYRQRRGNSPVEHSHHQRGFEAVWPWTCCAVEEKKFPVRAMPVTPANGDDIVRPVWRRKVCHPILQQLRRAARSNLLQLHVFPLVQTPIDHQGIDGRTEQDATLQDTPVIRRDAELRDPAPERLFCCFSRSPVPWGRGTRAREEDEGESYLSGHGHRNTPYSPGTPNPTSPSCQPHRWASSCTMDCA